MMQEEAPPKLHTRGGPMGEDYDETLCGEPGFRIGFAYLGGVMPQLGGFQTCVECAALVAWLYRHPEVVEFMRDRRRGLVALDSARASEARLAEIKSPEQPPLSPTDEENLRRDAAQWWHDRNPLDNP